MRALLRSLLLIAALLTGMATTADRALAQDASTTVTETDKIAPMTGPSMRAGPASTWAMQGTDRPTTPEDWRVLEDAYLRVHHDPNDRAVALLLARHGAKTLPEFADRLGVASGGTIDIYLAHTQEQFDSWQPGVPPDWADGTAWPLRGLIFLRSPEIRPGTEEPLTTVLDHEIVHVLLGRAFRGRTVPRWLQEGVAQVYARQYTSETTATLAKGLLGRDLMTLDDLSTGFPADPVRARLAYAQSADLVAWFQNEHGEEAIPTIVGEMARGAGFGAAVRSATGQRVDQVDYAWRSRLEASGMWLQPLVSDTMMFSVGAFVLIIGFFGVRRRNMKKLDRMEAEERSRDAVARAMGMSGEAPFWDHPRPEADGHRDAVEDGPESWLH